MDTSPPNKRHLRLVKECEGPPPSGSADADNPEPVDVVEPNLAVARVADINNNADDPGGYPLGTELTEEIAKIFDDLSGGPNEPGST